MISRRIVAAFVFCTLFIASGCAHTIRSATGEVVAGAAPAAAKSTLTLAEDDKLRERVAQALETPEIQRALAAVSRGVVHGATQQMAVDVPPLVDQLSQTVSKTLKKNMAGIEAGTDALTRRAVSAALDEALAEGRQAKMEKFMTNMTSALSKTLAAEMSTISPALSKAIKEDLGPAAGEVLKKETVGLLGSPELKDALAGIVREVSRQGVLGTNDGIAELAEKRRVEGKNAPLGAIGTFFSERTWLIGGLITALFLAIPIVWLMRQHRDAKRYRDEAERRANRAAALLAALQTLERLNEDSKEEVLSLLREELRDSDSDADSRPAAHQHH